MDRMKSSEFKKKKELEEARKAGTIPPKKDADGNLINPHNPDYISKRPWYLGESGPSLKHQNIQKDVHQLSISEADALYARGKKKRTLTKYKKGACKNCGAMSHQSTECVERPRKRGAWKTNEDIQQDEVLVDVRSENFGKLSFDAKRDQWLGYDPKEHADTIRRYDLIDAERQKKKLEQLNEKFSKTTDQKEGSELGDSDSDCGSDEHDSDDEEFKEKEGGHVISKRVARQGGVGGAELKTTVRNLRIREDTAKYLRNLNPNSAYYDPKTRSMRDNPTPDVNPENAAFAGENFVRHSGEVSQLAKTQLFAWEAGKKGSDIHPVATPSQAEYLRKEYEQKKEVLESARRQKIVGKYGGTEHMSAPSKSLLQNSESYVEYDTAGRVIKGQEKAQTLSKYTENVLQNNHTEIWGSWFNRSNMRWGFACCHSQVQNSYCTGDAGKAVNGVTSSNSAAGVREMLQPTNSKTKKVVNTNIDLYGETKDPEFDKSKVNQLLQTSASKKIDASQKYNSGKDLHKTTAEEMEVYKLSRVRADDPMKNMLDQN